MSNTTWGHIDNDKHLSTMYTTYEINETSQTYALPRYQWGDYADGGLITNLLDLSEYVEEMINGMIGEGKILSKQSYIQLFTPQLNKTHFPDGRDESIYNDGYNYSIFWGLDFEGNANHNGFDDGATAHVLINPRTGIGTIVFSNVGDNVFGDLLGITRKWGQKVK